MCDSVPEIHSALIHTAFVPKEGYQFIVLDFVAIEAHMLSFLANGTWHLKVFADNGDIYCTSALAIFHVSIEKTLSHRFICSHVHEELIIERSMAVSLDAICEQIGEQT